MSLKVFGLEAFRRAVARGIKLAERVEEMLRESTCWQVVTPAQLGIVTFRYISKGRSSAELDTINQKIIEEMMVDGFAMLSSTVLRGQTVLRLCNINPRTSEVDIRETIQKLERFGNHGTMRAVGVPIPE